MSKNQFYETRELFKNYTGYTKPLTYDEWVSIPDDQKAAVLYVQFYEQITLAWQKTKSFYTLQEDAVSTVLQYLIKNVPLLVAEPSRFRAPYIYRVAYNCLYCICHDIKRDRERFERECSNICKVGDDELDLFDTIVGVECMVDVMNREKLWQIIMTQSEDTQLVVYNIIDGTPLPEEVEEEKHNIIAQLKDIIEGAFTVEELSALYQE